jgi:putative transcriptional regulator
MRTRIKELRTKHDFTQQQLADMVGVRRETILFMESGKYNPSLKLAYQIANVFQVNIDEVFLFDQGDLNGK